ncbi:NADH/ubiquinone/plastoquinone [Intrasporangium oryzae NRRL B-24470]|uniref:NADH/ubiquinone/plastoquinone n=1 Tax=Intrasporangium oryzae NRRL B-24470 TaxID=1386089 RepID=W9GA11_9MICO|nr:NADH-quinone oxidoreductase subunit N [Intrasporangium oryzae]EWT00714.1 NADH/ubiquinone/plastoquinone [Intrasporangium oryzae NRRL B-24470]
MKNLTIDVVALLPALLPIGAVIVVLVVDLVTPRLRAVPWGIAAAAALGVVATAGLSLVRADSNGGGGATLCLTGQPGGGATTDRLPDLQGLPATCFWHADALGSTLQLAAGLAALVCIGLAWPRSGARMPGATQAPVEAVLLLTALSGTVVVAASRDLGTWLIALELATLPVIALVALSGRRAAVAGAVQLLVTSLVSFALLALGAALWFTATGSPFLTPDAAVSPGGGQVTYSSVTAGLISLSVVLILAGIGFKLSLVPFHAWTPTAYAGSSTAVATFLATVSKIAALAALLVVVRAVAALGAPALVAVGLLAALSMTLGNLMALRQDDVIRLLAWSTVAQAGWVVMPLVSVSTLGATSSATYLLTYVVATLVAFAVVALTVRESAASGRSLAAYEGLWHRSRWRAGALAIALTSLAGLPPGVIGLVGKVVALRPVVVEGWVWLAVIAAVNAVLGVAVYLRWLRPVVTVTRTSDQPVAATAGPGHRPAIVAVLALAAAVLVVLSIQPDLLLRLLG